MGFNEQRQLGDRLRAALATPDDRAAERRERVLRLGFFITSTGPTPRPRSLPRDRSSVPGIYHQFADFPEEKKTRMSHPAYRSFADFEREEIRPGMRVGWSTDELEESSSRELDFDVDPWEAAVDAAVYEKDDDEDDE